MLTGHYANEAFQATFEVLRLPQQEVLFGSHLPTDFDRKMIGMGV